MYYGRRRIGVGEGGGGEKAMNIIIKKKTSRNAIKLSRRRYDQTHTALITILFFVCNLKQKAFH